MLGERRHTFTPQIGAFQNIDSGNRDTGGRLYLSTLRYIRAGETLQGFAMRARLLSHRLYSLLSPRTVYVVGAYLVSLSAFPEGIKSVFIDMDRDANANLVNNDDKVKWSTLTFREIYNNYFATRDYLLGELGTTDSEQVNSTEWVTDAQLPNLIRTMEVVADDELEPMWHEFIQWNTGRTPPRVGIERCFQQVVRAPMLMPQLYPGYSRSLVGPLGASIPIYSRKNRYATEPSFLGIVVGMWEEPNNTRKYGLGATNVAGVTNPSAELFDTDKLRDWESLQIRYPRQIFAESGDASTLRGDIGDVNVLNYYEYGHFDFHEDWDPEWIHPGLDPKADAAATKPADQLPTYQQEGDKAVTTLSDANRDTTEGGHNFPHQVRLGGGLSILSDLRNF